MVRLRKLFELPHTLGTPATDTEQLVDLVWTPDNAHLVAITRLADKPARSRVFLIDAADAPETSDPSAAFELLLLPAEIVPASASPDLTGRWLAFLAHSTTTSSAANGLTLCVLELRPSGHFRDLGDPASPHLRRDHRPRRLASSAGEESRGNPGSGFSRAGAASATLACTC